MSELGSSPVMLPFCCSVSGILFVASFISVVADFGGSTIVSCSGTFWLFPFLGVCLGSLGECGGRSCRNVRLFQELWLLLVVLGWFLIVR